MSASPSLVRTSHSAPTSARAPRDRFAEWSNSNDGWYAARNNDTLSTTGDHGARLKMVRPAEDPLKSNIGEGPKITRAGSGLSIVQIDDPSRGSSTATGRLMVASPSQHPPTSVKPVVTKPPVHTWAAVAAQKVISAKSEPFPTLKDARASAQENKGGQGATSGRKPAVKPTPIARNQGGPKLD